MSDLVLATLCGHPQCRLLDGGCANHVPAGRAAAGASGERCGTCGHGFRWASLLEPNLYMHASDMEAQQSRVFERYSGMVMDHEDCSTCGVSFGGEGFYSQHYALGVFDGGTCNCARHLECWEALVPHLESTDAGRRVCDMCGLEVTKTFVIMMEREIARGAG